MTNRDLLKELIVSLGFELCPYYPNKVGDYACARAIIDNWYYLRFFKPDWNRTLACYAEPRRISSHLSTMVFSVDLADPSSFDVIRSKVDEWLKSHSLILAACDGKLWS